MKIRGQLRLNHNITSNISTHAQESIFHQPAMSDYGTMGGSSFACEDSSSYSGYYGWHLFNDNTTLWGASGTYQGHIIFYNPDALKVSSLNIRNYQASYVSKSGYVYGSHNGANWTQLKYYTNSNTTSKGVWTVTVNSPAYYKYYKVTFNAGSGSYIQCEYININATYIAKDYLYDLANVYVSETPIAYSIKY